MPIEEGAEMLQLGLEASWQFYRQVEERIKRHLPVNVQAVKHQMFKTQRSRQGQNKGKYFEYSHSMLIVSFAFEILVIELVKMLPSNSRLSKVAAKDDATKR